MGLTHLNYVDFWARPWPRAGERVYLAGNGATTVRRRLRAWAWADRIRVYHDDVDGASLLVDTVALWSAAARPS